MTPLYIDFEFGKSKERYLSLVCCVYSYQGVTYTHSLLDSNNKAKCKNDLQAIADRHSDLTIISYGVDAEVRALMSLFKVNHINALPFHHFVCLYREHKMLSNKYKKLLYGEVIGGGVKTRRQFNFEKQKENNSEDKKYINLLNALFKYCGIYSQEHTSYKKLYTEMCVRHHGPELENNMEGIIEYCKMDVEHLPKLFTAMWKDEELRLKEFNKYKIWWWMLTRGYYGAIVAEKVQNGYYIDKDKYYNISSSYVKIQATICEYINKKWPVNTFVYDQKSSRFVFKADVVQTYINTQAPAYVKKCFKITPKTKNLSISMNAFKQLYENKKHNLDRNDYLQQIYRYLYTMNSLRGVVRRKSTDNKSKPFRDYFDSLEGVMRPHFDDYGSQTSRSQPKANGYLLAKPAWMRILLVPPPNHVMISGDYSKQEVLYFGVVSQDKALIEAYASGDPYVAFGESVGIFKGLVKGTSDYDIARHACKQIVLANQYGITKYGLSVQLSQIYNRPVGLWEAQKRIDDFQRAYPTAHRWKRKMVDQYRASGKITLSDGWTLWGNNYNDRSVGNFPVQGGCASIMRQADILCHQKGLAIPMTLHDGLYAYSPCETGIRYKDVATLVQCMRDAFVQGLGYLPGADLIDIDLKIIGKKILTEPQPPYMLVEGRKYNLEFDELYRDKRAKNDLETFGPFMELDIQKKIEGFNIPYGRVCL